MKIYNLTFINYGDCLLARWENYCFGKYSRVFKSVKEACEWFTAHGWHS